jgi:hypothetical protein
MLEHFPDPYPDEILYSVWARFSDNVRYPLKNDVFQELFGYENASPVIDLPCHLGYFVDHLPTGHKYDVDYFIRNHTLLPFYASFLPLEKYKSIREQMISGSGEGIHAKIGTQGYPISRPSWLRFCPLCLKGDKERFGECYWHRLHQVPGVEICLIHRIFLENSSFAVVGLLKERRFISAENVSWSVAPRMVTSSSLSQILSDIVKDVIYLLRTAFLFPNDHILYERYSFLLSQRNLLTRKGLVRNVEMMEAFEDYYPPSVLALLHCDVNKTHGRNNWPIKLVTPSRGSGHPLWHILVIHFLHSTVEAFFHQLEPAIQALKNTLPFGRGPWPCLNPVCEYYSQLCIPSYVISQSSEMRPPECPVGIFACSCGFVYSRVGPDRMHHDRFRKDRVLTYGPAWETKLRELWSDTTLSLRGIARQLGADVGKVNRQAVKLQLPVPRNSPFLLKLEVTQRRHTKGETLFYRDQWLSLMKEAPDQGAGSLRKKSPQVYEWLRKYDKEWFNVHRPLRKFKQRSQATLSLMTKTSPSEDNVCQDELIAEAIKIAACKLVSDTDQSPPKRITMKSIFLQVPQVKKMWQNRAEAPITFRALHEVVETTEEFAIRRIHWVVHKYRDENICPTRSGIIRRLKISHVRNSPDVLQALDEAMVELSQITGF